MQKSCINKISILPTMFNATKIDSVSSILSSVGQNRSNERTNNTKFLSEQTTVPSTQMKMGIRTNASADDDDSANKIIRKKEKHKCKIN